MPPEGALESTYILFQRHYTQRVYADLKQGAVVSEWRERKEKRVMAAMEIKMPLFKPG